MPTFRHFVAFLLLAAFGCEPHAQTTDTLPLDRTRALEATGERLDVSRQTAITRAVEVAAPAVVSINVIEVRQVRVRDPFADPFFEQFFGRRRSQVVEQQVQGVGSGFIVSPEGYIVTNDHVAGQATKITVALGDGSTLEARLIGTDPASDLALLKVDSDAPLPHLSFAESGGPIVGEWAIALGNPFGLFEASEPSVTVGVVSAATRDIRAGQGQVFRDMIQTDAAINQGNSGGPLLNALGEVIGVNSAIFSPSGGSVGLGFAVPATKARRVIDELRENGTVDRSYYTGLLGYDVNARIAKALGLSEARGVLIRDVEQGSPAEASGIRPYDVMIALEGEPVGNQAEFVSALYDFRPGDTIRLTLVREGTERTVPLKIGRAE